MLDPLYDEEWRMARLERLGMKEDPFKLSADPRYLYLGPEHLAGISTGAGSDIATTGSGFNCRRYGHGKEFAGQTIV